MASEIDLVISVGLFILFIALLFIFLVNYLTSYRSLTSTSELRSVAYNIYNNLFSSKGLPSDWENRTYTPIKIGLVSDLYKIPVYVNETNGTNRGTITINVSISFDSNCESKAWNATVRVYNESNEEEPSKLFNQTYCSDRYLNKSDVVFNTSLTANQTKIFYIYYSPDQDIAESNYSITFPNVTNITVQVYPEEQLTALSVAKLKALRNKSYDEVITTIGTEYKFNVEISK